MSHHGQQTRAIQETTLVHVLAFGPVTRLEVELYTKATRHAIKSCCNWDTHVQLFDKATAVCALTVPLPYVSKPTSTPLSSVMLPGSPPSLRGWGAWTLVNSYMAQARRIRSWGMKLSSIDSTP